MEVVHALSGPRNVSTALMYSFAQRPGWSVLDEPFYAAYLARTGADHPGRDEVLASQPVQSEEVWRRLQALNGPTYIKNMAHHMDWLDLAPAAAWKHVLWIRSPRKVIASFAKVVPDVPAGHGEICLAGGFGWITHGSLEVGIKIGKAILVKV